MGNLQKMLKHKFSCALKLFQKIKLHKSSEDRLEAKIKDFFQNSLLNMNQKNGKLSESANSAQAPETQQALNSENPAKKNLLFANKSMDFLRGGKHAEPSPAPSLMDSFDFQSSWNDEDGKLIPTETVEESQIKELVYKIRDTDLDQINRISLKMKDIGDLLKLFAENLEQQDEITMESSPRSKL